MCNILYIHTNTDHTEIHSYASSLWSRTHVCETEMFRRVDGCCFINAADTETTMPVYEVYLHVCWPFILVCCHFPACQKKHEVDANEEPFFSPHCWTNTFTIPNWSQCWHNNETAFSHWTTRQTGLWNTWLVPFLPPEVRVWVHDSRNVIKGLRKLWTHRPGVGVTGCGRPFQQRARRKLSEDVGSDQSGPAHTLRAIHAALWRLRLWHDYLTSWLDHMSEWVWVA